jgi:hypothetical protein
MNVDAKTAATSYFFSELTRDYPETKRLCPPKKEPRRPKKRAAGYNLRFHESQPQQNHLKRNI